MSLKVGIFRFYLILFTLYTVLSMIEFSVMYSSIIVLVSYKFLVRFLANG